VIRFGRGHGEVLRLAVGEDAGTKSGYSFVEANHSVHGTVPGPRPYGHAFTARGEAGWATGRLIAAGRGGAA